MVNPSYRTAIVIAILMLAASAIAVVSRPTTKLADERPGISLKNMIPTEFDDWREEAGAVVQVVDAQKQEKLDTLYSQILNRSYVNANGYRIMLSIVYGNNQTGSLEAHKPEWCYPSQGFVLHKNEAGLLTTAFGGIPVRRLFTSLGAREEPVTYWFTVGDEAVQGKWQKRLVDLRYGLTGRIPDGLLFRVSSIDPDQVQANRMQDQFINQLLQTVSPAERKRLSGLGDS